ncbi:PREDICTED: glycerophosphodiester phosphodiesterase domain-containing protein 5-like, partial [Elephantulus edwardii]|uniref:glycerophosphodiester phosphodiesterase domain-containing protein 5-like n=1 Tax=Elephantulus edwardii TaxID=28737 RepID=UPI0003F06EBE
AENQMIPALEELLKEAAVLHLFIMCDLCSPPQNYTYHDGFVNQTLEAVLSARLPQAMVILPRSLWILNHRSFGYPMKITLMSNNRLPKCIRYMDSREATELRGPSFSTYPITVGYQVSTQR